MKNEKIIKKYRRSSLANPTIKISLKSKDNNDINSNLGNSIISNDDAQQNRRKKVKFFTNELHIKTDLSPPNTIIKNSILKRENKNLSIDNFFKRLKQKHLFTISGKKTKKEYNNLFTKRKSKKNNTIVIPSINPNKINLLQNKMDSDSKLEEIRKNNKYYKFYPILNFNKNKDKQLPLDKNINNNLKCKFMNNTIQNSNENDINRTRKKNILLNHLFPTSINEISEINKNNIGSISIKENNKNNKTN